MWERWGESYRWERWGELNRYEKCGKSHRWSSHSLHWRQTCTAYRGRWQAGRCRDENDLQPPWLDLLQFLQQSYTRNPTSRQLPAKPPHHTHLCQSATGSYRIYWTKRDISLYVMDITPIIQERRLLWTVRSLPVQSFLRDSFLVTINWTELNWILLNTLTAKMQNN